MTDWNKRIMEKIEEYINESKYSYSSVQLTITDETLKEKIFKLGSLIKEEDLYEENGYGRELSPHITVKYGIHSSNINEITNVIKNYKKKKVNYEILEISKFESDLYDVLILKVESEDLRTLNKMLEDNLKVTNTHPVYNPHITLAYVKKGVADNFINSNKSDLNNTKYFENNLVFSDKNGLERIINL